MRFAYCRPLGKLSFAATWTNTRQVVQVPINLSDTAMYEVGTAGREGWLTKIPSRRQGAGRIQFGSQVPAESAFLS
jgi:hypothetical protein